MNPLNAWTLLTTRSIGIGFEPSGFGSMKPSDVALALRGLERSRFLLGMAALCGDKAGLGELVGHVREEIILPTASFFEWDVKGRALEFRKVAEVLLFEALQRDEFDRGVRCFVCHGKKRYTPPDDIHALTPDEKARRARRSDVRQVRRRLRVLKRLTTTAAEELKAAGKRAEKAKIKRFQTLLRWSNQLAQMAQVSQVPGECITCRGTGVVRLNHTHRAWLGRIEYNAWCAAWGSHYETLQRELDGWVSDCLTHVGDAFRGRAA